MAITITAQPVNQTVVENGTAVFTVAATGEGLSYQWEHMTPTGTKWITTTAGTGTTTNELSIEALAYHDGYIYHCVITDANGNSVTSESAKLTIARIVISQQPDDQMVAEGSTVVFTVTAEGNSLTYQWQWRANSTAAWGNTTVTGNQTKSITVEATIARNGYQYRCLIKDANGNTKLSNAVTLIVESQTNPITITSQPTSVTTVLGSKVVFTVTADGEGLTYQWEWRANSAADWGNTTVAGNQTNSITIEETTGRNGYQYRCLIKDANGYGKLSNVVTLTVVSIIITKQPVDIAAVGGDTVTFHVEATGVSKYQWQCTQNDGYSWTNLTWGGYASSTMTRQMNINNIQYQYRCQLTDADGNVTYTNVIRFINTPCLIQPDALKAIAIAVREKTDETKHLTPTEMAEKINGLPKIIHGTEDLEEGVSELATGVYYFYEQST